MRGREYSWGAVNIEDKVTITVFPSRLLLHCNDNSIYFLLEEELRGFSPNFYILVPVRELYIPRIGPHIFLLQNMQTDRGNI